MVPERHEYVARIAPDNNIFGAFSQAQTVPGQVALQASAMILCLKLRDEFVNGLQATIDPWREVGYNTQPEVLKNEMKHDVLRPRRATFVRCRNDDIANSFRDMVPARAVQQEILVNVLAGKRFLFQLSAPFRLMSWNKIVGESYSFVAASQTLMSRRTDPNSPATPEPKASPNWPNLALTRAQGPKLPCGAAHQP